MFVKVLEEVLNLKLHNLTLVFFPFFFQNMINFHQNWLLHKNQFIIPRWSVLSKELIEHGQELDEALPFLCPTLEAEPLQFHGISISQALPFSLACRPSPFFCSWGNWSSGIHSASELPYVLVLCWLALALLAYFWEHCNCLCAKVCFSGKTFKNIPVLKQYTVMQQTRQ